jgi:tyrosinase
MNSRREVLLQGGVIGAGYFATQLLGIQAFAQPTKPLRRSVSELQPNDPNLQALREGVRQLKAKPAGDKFNWINLSSIHGTSAGFNLCTHGNWYFLPWHRAYLLMYERAIRDVTGFKEFALPYWDWTRNPQLPTAFTQPAPNPLFEPRDMTATDTLPPENVGQPVLDSVLGDSPFEKFGTTRPEGQNSLDQSWLKKRNGDQGTLESNPHNNVHGLVGGVMASSRSARDPIFFMHHCNIDRIWALWRTAGNDDTTDTLWRDMQFKDHFFNPDGSVWSPKVSELQDYEALGYTYGLPQAQTLSSTVISLNKKLTELIAAPSGQAVNDVKTFQASNTGVAAANDPLAVPVKVSSALVAAAARREPGQGSGTELLNFSFARERAASKTRAYAFIRDIDLKNEQNSQYRVFIDCDYLSQATPIGDKHYVGTFGFFGDHAGHQDTKPSVAVDLTAALEKLYGSVAEAPDTLKVQILPVPRGKASVAETGNATPSRVEVAFVSP